MNRQAQHDNIISGDGDNVNIEDTDVGQGSGDDNIISGDEDDRNTGNRGRDIFVCGDGEDTVTDYNEAEGDMEHLIVRTYRIWRIETISSFLICPRHCWWVLSDNFLKRAQNNAVVTLNSKNVLGGS